MPYEKSDKKTKKFGKFVALSAFYLAASGSFAASPTEQVAQAPAASVSAPVKKEKGAKVKHKKSKRTDKAISPAK